MKYIGVICVFIFFSCKKNESPEISIESPIEHSTLYKGSSMNLSIELSDDKGLAYYHIHIGDQLGEHTLLFPFHESTEISGKNYSYKSSVQIPENIENVYYLHVEVKDEQGNTTNQQIMLHFE